MKTFMFPGQGAQSKGMGGNLFDKFGELTAKADKILGYSIKELCLEDPRGELNQTQFTQPALYVVNAFSYFSRMEETGETPDYLIGHSLGEFNALLAAGCFEFEAGLKLVKKRGELMGEATGGAMAAIINSSKEEIENILSDNSLNDIDLANYNAPSQIVISGSRKDIEEAQKYFQTGKTLYYPLNTSGAFHSRYMKPAGEKFKTYLKKFKLESPNVPVVSNVTAEPYSDDKIVENLADQISSPVRWTESVQFLMEKGDMNFEEIGPGEVLTRLVQKIEKERGSVSGSRETAMRSESTADEQTINGDKSAQDQSREKGEQVGIGIRSTASETELEGDSSKSTNQISFAPEASASAHQKVADWNRNYAVGTKVESTVIDYGELETRTEALVLFGHRAAVYMKGYNGYFDLDEVRLAQ